MLAKAPKADKINRDRSIANVISFEPVHRSILGHCRRQAPQPLTKSVSVSHETMLKP
jgi:hypothetical protein